MAGMALAFIVMLFAYRLPAAPNINSPGLESPLRASLQELLGDGVPHPLGSAADARLRDELVTKLKALGYSVELQSGWACNRYAICGRPTNIVALPPGVTDNAVKDAVLLAAHYDSVPAGPGASDDGSGVVIALDIAAQLALKPHKHPVVVLLSDGEEAGLLGALLFVSEHPLAKTIKAAVNLEARGVSGPSLMFETGGSNLWLMRLFQQAVARPITDSLFYVIYRALPNDTDFTAFRAAGFEGYNFAFIGDVGHYHTPLDNAGALDESTLQHQYRSARSALYALADAPELKSTPSDAVFFDVGSRALLVWSFGVNLALACIAPFVIVVSVVVLVRRRAFTLREVLLGALGSLASAVAGILIALIIVVIVCAIDGLPTLAWISFPLGAQVSCVAVAFMTAALSAGLFARGAGLAGTWFGAALLTAVLALILAIVLPGASFILLLPALTAALVSLPCLLLRDPARGVRVAIIATIIITMLLVTPVMSLSYDGLGVLSFPVMTVLLCFVTWHMLALYAGGGALAWRRRSIMITGLIAVLGMFASLSESAYSERWPLRLNFEYHLDADTKQAHFFADSDGKHLPRRVRVAAHFGDHAHVPFAGSERKVFFAAAPYRNLPAPELTVKSAVRETGRVRYFLHLQSPRGAPEAYLIFPAVAAVNDVRLPERAEGARIPLREMAGGASMLSFQGLPPDGVDFSLDATATPVKLALFDESYELVEGGFLKSARPQDATSTQDGDVTVVQHSVTLNPAAGR